MEKLKRLSSIFSTPIKLLGAGRDHFQGCIRKEISLAVPGTEHRRVLSENRESQGGHE